MELDDLRRQWREPEPAKAPAALTPAQLSALLTRQRGGLVEKMRRNARRETILVALLGVGAAVALPFLPELRLLLYAQLLLTAGLLIYAYRMLAVLRRMAETASSVRGHLRQLYDGLRQLLRFYYQLSMASGPVMFVAVYAAILIPNLLKKHFMTKRLLVLGVIFLLVGIVVQYLIKDVTRWWVQRLYGQHLDRLESQLHELEDANPPGATGG